MLHNELKTYLENWEREKKALTVYIGEPMIIGDAIKNILTEDKEYKRTKEDVLEWMAFDFFPDHPSDTGWGTYYGPMWVLPDQKTGQMIEHPSIQLVDQEALEYWTKRAKECQNPILSSRYADLVVDFSKKILNKNADIALVQKVIDSNVAICENSLAYSLDCITKIRRALVLATRIGDRVRIARVKDAIIKLENDIAEDGKPGLWGFAFGWLVLDSTGKVCLDEVERGKLVEILENRLKSVEQDPWLAEKAVHLLAEYYAREQDEENLMRILSVYENAFKSDQRSNSDSMLKTSSYEQVLTLYRKYASRFSRAEEGRKRVLREFGQQDLDWEKSLKKVSTKVNIPQGKIDEFIDRTFGSNGRDPLEMVFGRIALANLLKKEDMKKEFDYIVKKFPLQFMFSQQLISEEGIPIAQYRGIPDDYENHFYNWARQGLDIGTFLLSLSMDKFKELFSKEEIIEHFERSVIFTGENEEYLKRAIASYWSNDYLVSSHLFVSLIESGIRKLIEICGGQHIEPNKEGGYDYLSLHTLFRKREPIFKAAFPVIGEDLLFNLRLVLTEKLGWNLRNSIAHGIDKSKFLKREAPDRLFYILIWLSMVERKNRPE